MKIKYCNDIQTEFFSLEIYFVKWFSQNVLETFKQFQQDARLSRETIAL